MFLAKIVEKLDTHLIYSMQFFFFENRTVYEII